MARPDHTPGIFQRGRLLRAQQLRCLSPCPSHHPARGLWAFAGKQLLHIYLSYWPVLLLALTTLLVHGESMPTPRKVVMSTLLLYPNIWDKWLAPAWSLSMELYFYLWIALLTPVPREYRVRAITCTMAALFVWGTGWLLADHQRVFERQQPLRYGLTGLGVEFLAGALLARACDSRARLFAKPVATVTVCIALTAAGLALGTTSPYFDRVEVMGRASFGVVGVFLLAIAVTLERAGSSRCTGWWRSGTLLTSPYLLYTSLLGASGRWRFNLDIQWPRLLPAHIVTLPIAIVLLSLLWYRWVERPPLRVLS